MSMVVHLKYLLLLSRQVLWLAISIHDCEAHGSWHKYIIIVSIVLASPGIRRFHEVILIWCPGLK